jgi:hypothetical protein
MKFNWFKRKEELTPEAVLELIKADAEKAIGLPILVADADFMEFLQEESVGETIEMVEAAELFAIWMAENCQ